MHDHATKTLSASAASSESGIPKRTILYAIQTRKLRAEKLPGVGYIIKRRDFERWRATREAVSA
ncbi:hypothetical protein [Gordonia rubripertincta]|uniref:hypothetical protein n=1 Tax=Gordonia rubripertincta TaxID=36822 RepID=UPI0015F8B94B|nr:hypothetical protein [Gordonia rubripertincta]QMU22013.1 hypothetical protein H3V45_05860 [Gordonia rubripertincta]